MNLLALSHPRLTLFMINEDEGDKRDNRTDPVHNARVLGIDDHLADKGERDCQAESHSNNERGGEKHGIGPAEV